MTLDPNALNAAMDAFHADRSRYGYTPGVKAAITAYLSALSEKGVRLMPREANDAMWDAGDRLFPALNEIGNGIEEHGEDVLYEVIPGPGKIWEAMFDAHSEPRP